MELRTNEPFKYAYPDLVVRPDIKLLTSLPKHGFDVIQIMWLQRGNYAKKFDNISLYYMDFWFCYPRTPKCQFIWLTHDIWFEALDLNDVQYKQVVEEKLKEYGFELIKYLGREDTC